MNKNNEKLELHCYSTIKNEKGLHARASAKFVEIVHQFKAEVKVKKGDMEVSGDSIMGLLTLGAHKGSRIDIWVKGKEAQELIEALQKLIDEKFGED